MKAITMQVRCRAGRAGFAFEIPTVSFAGTTDDYDHAWVAARIRFTSESGIAVGSRELGNAALASRTVAS
jgi:hypothetical protein